MKQNEYSNKIESFINEIPSLPVSAGKVMEVCNNRNVNPSDLNKVIELDPVLTGKLLKLINSAYYGLGTHVTSLIKAITMLGINTVKNLALSTAILGTLPKNRILDGLNMEGYWRHCLSVGVTSKLMAEMQGVDRKYHQEYFTAGLLHDIGKIALNAVLSEDYMLTVASADREHKQIYTLENDSLGINHCDAGIMISNAWKLDSPVSDVILWHHSVKEYYGEFLHILYNVAVADYFSIIYEIGFAGSRYPVKPEKNVWEAIGVNDNSFEEIKDKVFLEIEKAKIFLKI
ncbi:MAG: HDOD domain-containing protein [Treponema sp.]|nr:HDOD domain-containing protein [Treponema sp.]